MFYDISYQNRRRPNLTLALNTIDSFRETIKKTFFSYQTEKKLLICRLNRVRCGIFDIQVAKLTNMCFEDVCRKSEWGKKRPWLVFPDIGERHVTAESYFRRDSKKSISFFCKFFQACGSFLPQHSFESAALQFFDTLR